MRDGATGAGLAWVSGWGELTLEALREVWSHKVRSLLTLFGIVFGAASVVSLTSLATALKDMAYAELTAMGMPATVAFRDRPPPIAATRGAGLRHAGPTPGDVAALRGHEVFLYEKDKLGGQLNLACVPPGKADFRLFIDFELEQ